jgi:hypothetical protein
MNDGYSRGRIIGTSTLAITITVLIGVLCRWVDVNPPSWVINLAIAVFGICMGWLIGVVVSPYDEKETKEFSGYAKVISPFLSGYVLSKVDKFLNFDLTNQTSVDIVLIIRVLILISSFLVMMLITFYFRRYAFNAADEAKATAAKQAAAGT